MFHPWLVSLPIRAKSSYNVELEPAAPFWVVEHVSESNKRKDYKDSFKKYERHLQVSYYLIFDPETQELTLYHHTGEQYERVAANAAGGYAIPELDLEVGLLDGWVRFWYQGQLLLLPAELQRRADTEQRRADEMAQRAAAEAAACAALEREVAELRARLRQTPP